MTSSSKNILSSVSYTVRVASLADANVLLEFGAKTFYDTFAEHNSEADMKMYLEKTFTVDLVKQEINDPRVTFLLVFTGDSVIGYAKLREGHSPAELNDEGAIEIERIYVHKDYLGKNVGQLLMRSCINIAKERDYTFIWLGVWEHNSRAIGFYEKCGFEKFGSHPFLLGTDLQTDILMKKKLG
jgi:ribosomal protein S18 acetylase RimI-like enzyme